MRSLLVNFDYDSRFIIPKHKSLSFEEIIDFLDSFIKVHDNNEVYTISKEQSFSIELIDNNKIKKEDSL